MGDSAYQARLRPTANADVDILRTKWGEYGNSWKKRGGANAYFMLCRKFDRLENQVERHHHDIFAAALSDQREEGILDDIGDLRRYLLLVEAEVRERMEDKIFEKRTCETCCGEYKAHPMEDERRHCLECVRPKPSDGTKPGVVEHPDRFA